MIDLKVCGWVTIAVALVLLMLCALCYYDAEEGDMMGPTMAKVCSQKMWICGAGAVLGVVGLWCLWQGGVLRM